MKVCSAHFFRPKCYGGVSGFHPRGADTTMFDGSVRFIRDDIDMGDLFASGANQAVKGKRTCDVPGGAQLNQRQGNRLVLRERIR
ncbi:MAG: DUF1559 domain-containing protein [Thermoguttaceae bacterium]